MSAPTIPSGGGSTVNRKWVPQVNTGSVLAPTWVTIGFVSNFVPVVDAANLVDSTTFGDGGFSSQDKTGAACSATCTVMRKIPDDDPTTYDVAQEFLRTKSIGTFGAANRVQLRWFEYDVNDPTGALSPRVEAYQASFAVSWAEQGGDQAAESTVTITFTGQGKCSQITHPYPTTPVVAVIDRATPLAGTTAGGTEVSIFGHGFTGTTGSTGVKFGTTNATSYVVEDDTLIVAVAPAHSAGSANIVVTNPVGASTTTNPAFVYS